jgi:arsenate reductase (glutaredoxin)
MKDNVIVYHNPRCSKSRCALDLLKDKGIDFEVVEYLNEVPTESTLRDVIAKLGIKPEELVRKSEDDFKSHFKGKTLTDDEWIKAMLKFPKLIERPIVIRNEKAVIARPTERIEELF